MAYLIKQLPPLRQARELFEHFATVLHPIFNVLHLPSSRALLEEMYQKLLNGQEHQGIANLLMLFSIFAGAALAWTPQMLKHLDCTQEAAKAAFTAYTDIGVSTLDNAHPSMPPSTVSLAAIATLAQVITNTDGYAFKVHMLRSRCLLMART